MWDWQVVLVASITFSVIMGIIILIYTFMTAKRMRGQQARMQELINEVKPGAKVIFGGGIVGSVVSVKDNFAKVKIDKTTTVEVAVYSISNILTD